MNDTLDPVTLRYVATEMRKEANYDNAQYKSFHYFCTHHHDGGSDADKIKLRHMKEVEVIKLGYSTYFFDLAERAEKDLK